MGCNKLNLIQYSWSLNSFLTVKYFVESSANVLSQHVSETRPVIISPSGNISSISFNFENCVWKKKCTVTQILSFAFSLSYLFAGGDRP